MLTIWFMLWVIGFWLLPPVAAILGFRWCAVGLAKGWHGISHRSYSLRGRNYSKPVDQIASKTDDV